MIKSKILKELSSEFLAKKQLAEKQAENNLFYALKNQDYAYLDSQVNVLTIEIAKAEFENNQAQATKLRKQKETLQAEQEKMLNSMGLTLKALKPNYACNKCCDTGFIKGKPCDCFKIELSNKLLAQSNIKFENLANFNKSNFEVFSEKYKKDIQKIYSLMQEFCVKFPNTNDKTKIVFSGGTGTGKTFLLECISAELLRKGHFVYYTTAFNINNQLLKYHVAPLEEKQGIINTFLDCDCLIIDDLGVEPIRKNVTLEYLLAIISERSINSKHTIISTNLSPEDIFNRYGERIYSRIVDKSNSVVINFPGDDLRVKRS